MGRRVQEGREKEGSGDEGRGSGGDLLNLCTDKIRRNLAKKPAGNLFTLGTFTAPTIHGILRRVIICSFTY